ncbi:TlpA family protein disulfide reductase [Cohnella terricola]|uniref:TlpA family protein disulfide reductase n=1 Tax=Cohnella terricola TaxID=1289167 RepID=A0A559JB56_9BACL|nr:TlpA disulfide reductase family protein [Cohnella terricola]TVX97114.1 TlpA family protein disulfide reductase [Cohnella terricola]
MKKIGQWAVIVAAIIIAVFWAMKSPDRPTEARMGEQAPMISLPSLDGHSYALRPEPGKALIVNFWASWCEPCRREAPELQEFHDRHQDEANVLAVNLTSKDQIDLAFAFAQQNNLLIPVLLDEKSEAANAYHIASLPTTYVIAPDGKISARKIGQVDRETLETFIQDAFK